MTYIRYKEVSAWTYKRGRCEVCGKSAERSKTFTNTVSPFNRNEDGSVRTYAEVRARVNDLAMEWQRQPVRHARCEGVSDA